MAHAKSTSKGTLPIPDASAPRQLAGTVVLSQGPGLPVQTLQAMAPTMAESRKHVQALQEEDRVQHEAVERLLAQHEGVRRERRAAATRVKQQGPEAVPSCPLPPRLHDAQLNRLAHRCLVYWHSVHDALAGALSPAGIAALCTSTASTQL